MLERLILKEQIDGRIQSTLNLLIEVYDKLLKGEENKPVMVEDLTKLCDALKILFTAQATVVYDDYGWDQYKDLIYEMAERDTQ